MMNNSKRIGGSGIYARDRLVSNSVRLLAQSHLRYHPNSNHHAPFVSRLFYNSFFLGGMFFAKPMRYFSMLICIFQILIKFG